MSTVTGSGAGANGMGIALKPAKSGGRKALSGARGNAWELQARDLSRRFMEGESGLSRFITPAPASSKKVAARERGHRGSVIGDGEGAT